MLTIIRKRRPRPEISTRPSRNVIHEGMNFCQRHNDSIKRLAFNSSGGDPFDLDAAWQDIVQTCAANAGKTYTDVSYTSGSTTSTGRTFIKVTVTPSRDLFLTPLSRKNLLSFNPQTATFTNNGNLTTSAKNLFGKSVLGINNCVYYLPINYRSIVKLNLQTNELTEIGQNVVTGWRSGAVYKHYIYAVSQNSNKILVLNMLDDAFCFIETGLDKYGWSGLSYAPDGCLYGTPFSNRQTCILKINPQNNAFDSFGSFEAGCGYSPGVLAPNGCIYCAPLVSRSILKINPLSQTVSYLGSWSGAFKWNSGALAPNGCIYCSNNVSTSSILKIDPSSDQYTTFNSMPSAGWSGFALGLDGKLYGAPDNQTTMYVLDPGSSVMKNFNESTILSPLIQ